jgi:branched-chain amino acid transport system ATP-binding protein
MLEVRGLRAGYGDVPVLHDLDITVGEGELLALIGANGAGKTTLLRTISGLVPATAGSIVFDGSDIRGSAAPKVAALGVGHVPESRRIFPESTVDDNLRIGGWVRRRDRKGRQRRLEAAYERFPILAERRRDPAGLLSGGQQQMLAIAMVLVAAPRLILLDEPSLGLAPLIVKDVLEQVASLRDEGTSVLLVEQLAREALAVADRACVLRLGEITVEGTAAELIDNPEVLQAYLGTS